MRQPKLYRRLARAHQFGVATGGWLSLYLAQDHLLLRRTVAFTETYHRFFLTDIEAITVRKTTRWHIWTAVWICAIAICFVAMQAAQRAHPLAVAFAVLFAVCVLINVARGATCVTHLQTRVQTRMLPLRRVRKALRVIDKLRPAITTAQADIAFAPAPAPSPAAPVARQAETRTPATPPPLPGEQLPIERSVPHLVLFGLLIIAGLLAGMEAFARFGGLAYAVYALVLVNICAAVAVLVLQRRRRFSPRFTKIAWISAITHGVALPVAYTIFSWVHAFREASNASGPTPGSVQAFQLELSALRDLPGFDYLLMAYAAFALVLGLVGCGLLLTQPSRAALDPAP